MSLYDELKLRFEQPQVPAAPPAAEDGSRRALMDELLKRYRGSMDEGALRAAQAEDERNGALEGLGNQLSQTWFTVAGMKPPDPVKTPSRVGELAQQRQGYAQQLGMEGAAQGWERAEEDYQRQGRERLEQRSLDSGVSQQTRAFAATAIQVLRKNGIAVPNIDLASATAADLAPVLELYGKLANSAAAPRPPAPATQHFFPTADGSLMYADSKNPGGGAVPLIDRRTGKPVEGLKARRPLTVGQQAHLEDMRGQSDIMGGLLSTFRDEYAGRGMLGGFDVKKAQTLGSWAGADEQAFGSWWSDFQKLLDLPMRNKLFGASLTANEKQSWANAQKIQARSDPQLVRQALAELKAIVDGKMDRYARGLVADHAEPEAVEAFSGLKLGEPGAAPPAADFEERVTKDGRRLRKYTDGRIVEVK